MSQTLQSLYKRIVVEHNHDMSEIFVHGSKRQDPCAGWWKGRSGIVRFPLAEIAKAMEYARAIAPIVHTQAGSFYAVEEIRTGAL